MGNNMNMHNKQYKETLVVEFMKQAKCSEETAREYLISEEWLYFNALASYKADKKQEGK